MSATTPSEKDAASNQLTSTLKTLFAVSEAYPELKANTNFLDLQTQLTDIENQIAASRRYYNATVKDYNDAIVVFPNNILAGVFGFKSES
jgi:LemA protein